MASETKVLLSGKPEKKENILEKYGLTPLLLLNLCKATTGLFLSQLFLYLPQFKTIFPASLNGSPYLYVSIIAIAAQAGMTVGRLTDALVLMLSSIVFGLFLAWITALLAPSDILMAISTFLSFYFFLFFRQYSPRWLGFTIFGCLIAAFAIIGTVNGGYSNTIQPLVWYTIVSFLIGGLISFSVCVFVFPTFATIECRTIMQTWLSLITQLVTGTMKYYDGSDNDVARLDTLVVELRGIISQIEIILADASSEFNYSKLPYPVLQRLSKMLREVTEDAFGMLLAAKTFKKWAEGVKIDEGFDYTKMKTLVAKICTRVELLSKLIVAKLDVNFKSDLNTTEEDALIDACVDFESELRNSLEYHHSALNKDDKNWISNSESILSIYHFSMTVENTIKKFLNLDRDLNQIHQSRMSFYSPLYKWIPFSYVKAIIDTLNPNSYLRDGKFSVLVLMATFKRFLQKNVWTLKSAVCMTLFLTMFLSLSSRTFWNKYGLSGGLITLIIVLTPNMGSAYLAMIFQIIGSVLGNTLGMAFFYAFGHNPYLLWIPMVVIAFPSYYIMIKKPQFTSIPLLLLIGYSGMTISCWNQQFVTIPSLKFEYSWIWTRAVVSLLIGLGFGTAFNLFVFPSFAKHDIRIQVGDCLVEIESLYGRIMDVPYNYQTRIEGGMTKEESALMAKREVEALTTSLTMLSGKLFRLRILLIQATLEPEIEMKFVGSKYAEVIEGMEVILNGLKGARLALEEPWYRQESIRVIWEGLLDKRNNLVKTMQVVYRLYESSIVMKRKLPPNMPSALQVRGELSYHVLSTHLSKSLSENAKDGLEGISIDEDTDWKWRQARLKLYEREKNNRSFGVGTLTDIYYYSYVSWMKVVVQATDKLAGNIDQLF